MWTWFIDYAAANMWLTGCYQLFSFARSRLVTVVWLQQQNIDSTVHLDLVYLSVKMVTGIEIELLCFYTIKLKVFFFVLLVDKWFQEAWRWILNKNAFGEEQVIIKKQNWQLRGFREHFNLWCREVSPNDFVLLNFNVQVRIDRFLIIIIINFI